MADSRPRVLVADDERFFREAIVESLSEAGIDCQPVESADEALRAARDPAVGVVVLDVGLGGEAGLGLLRRLRGERPALRVIVLSDHADQDLVLEALRLDASDYLLKPLHDEELLLSVRRALAGFGVESSWIGLRERIRRLEARLAELSSRADQPELDFGGFAAATAEAVGEVLGAAKTSMMLLDEAAGELWVAAATGSAVDPAEMDRVRLGEGVAGVALSLGEGVLIDDVTADDRFGGRKLRERYESSSVVVLPLLRGDERLGVLCATDRVGGAPFGQDELALLKILAVPVRHLLVRQREAAARREPESAEPRPEVAAPLPASDGDADLAREICDALVHEIEPQRVLRGALRPAARRLRGTVALHLVDNTTGALALEAEIDDEGPPDRQGLPRDRGLTGAVLQTGSLVAAAHPERDPRFDREVDTASDGEVRPLLCVPLRLRGHSVGVLRVFPAPEIGAPARTAEILAAGCSAAVRNVLLYRSLLESIDELAQARREAGGGGR